MFSLYKIKFSLIEESLIYGMVFSLIGARLYHVLSSFSYYLKSPLEIFYIWNGGLGIFGAVSGGFLGLYIFSKSKKVNFQRLLNLIFPGMLLAQAIGRIGNFFNREGFGPPTKLPWGVYIPVSLRPIEYISSTFFHPTFFYEAALCLLAFLLFLLAYKKEKKIKYGFAYYLISYGLIRFFTEFFRIDTWTIYSVHVGQLFSLFLIFLGISIYINGENI